MATARWIFSSPPDGAACTATTRTRVSLLRKRRPPHADVHDADSERHVRVRCRDARRRRWRRHGGFSHHRRMERRARQPLGREYLYSGKDGHLMRTYTTRIPSDTFGFDAVTLGDVDGDGTVDFLITAGWSGVHGNHSDASISTPEKTATSCGRTRRGFRATRSGSMP